MLERIGGVKIIIMADKKFEEHMMYGDGKARKAKTNAEHLDLKKKGWGHNSPAPFKLREVNSPMKCWKGYKRTPGTKKGAKGSCYKPGKKKK
jgi:hypothetical protein